MKLERCIPNAKFPARKLVLFILIIAGLLIQSNCSFQNIAPDQFPDADIIFQTSTLKGGQTDETLGFVNEDGSSLTYLSVSVPGRLGGRSVPSLPIITGDGSAIIFRIKPDPLIPGELVVMNIGESPVICAIDPGMNRPMLTSDQSYVIVDLVSPPGRLVGFSPEECEEGMLDQTEEIYDVMTLQYYPESGALSPNGRSLAFVAWYKESDSSAIFVRDLASEQNIIVGYGIAPAWSPDGQRLAYRGEDGIYIVSADGTAEHLIVDYANPEEWRSYEVWPPLPSWSSDGKWLVYHKCTPYKGGVKRVCDAQEDYSIFKVNIEIAEEINILDGGLNPFWSWRDIEP